MNKILQYISVLLLLLTSGSVVCAQDFLDNGNWAGNDLLINTNTTINMARNLYLEGTVVVGNGATLTINGTNVNQPYKIRHNVKTFDTSVSGVDAMFKVESGAKLVINNVEIIGTSELFTIPNPYDVSSGQWQIEAVKSYIDNPVYNSTPVDGSILTLHKYNNGGIFYVIGSLELNNVTVSDCYSASGAAIYRPDDTGTVKFGTIAINKSTICRCVSDQQGAAIRLGQQGATNNTAEGCAVTITHSKIIQNISCFGHEEKDELDPLIGGAVCSVSESLSKVTITGSEFAYNYNTNRGGALTWITSNQERTLSVTGSRIHHNYSAKGGGITLLSGVTTITDCTIDNNTASDSGGGLYVNNAGLTAEGTILKENKSYTGAGVQSDGNGAQSYSNCEITDNDATNRGGGMFLNGKGDLSLTNVQISRNKAATRGGGVYCVRPVTATGCTITDNIALAGGGFFITTTTGNISFAGGKIQNNKATTSNPTAKTGYKENPQGYGGGVAITERATFSLSKGASSVSIFGNKADLGGDDIFANGNGTIVTLVPADDVDITEYPGSKWGLNWIEDYATGDTGYANGTALAGASHSSLRYRDAFDAEESQYSLAIPVGGSAYQEKYLCLAFAREVLYVTIVRRGLVKGENAIYRVSRFDENDTPSANDDWTLYSELMLFGPEDATTPEIAATKSVTRRIALYSGKWKIEETGWAWTYKREEGLVRQISGVTSMSEKTFVFNGSKLNETQEGYVPAENYNEATVTNDFGRTEVENDKSSPASTTGFEKITDSGVSW